MTTGVDSEKRGAWRRVKVIIVPEGDEQAPLRFDLDGIEFHYERGVRAIMPGWGAGGQGQAIRYEPNGQARLQILAWKGCQSFDAFEGRTEEDEGMAGAMERAQAIMADGRTLAQVAAGPPKRK